MVVTTISDSLYDKLPNLTLGFHGCHEEAYNNVIFGNQHLKRSTNDYDWLGNGIYFWENSYERALDWAQNKYKEDARVIGAIIDLGHCLNLTDYKNTKILQEAYDLTVQMHAVLGEELPQNKFGRSTTDLLLRNLDCTVIEMVHFLAKMDNSQWEPFDSVRGVFTEGKSAYPGAGIPEKTHIQISVVNPNCIKGYFAPISADNNYAVP